MSTDLLAEPFRFFSTAIWVASIAGALCGLVGVYIVLRGMSYIGHGLSHAVFGWAVISFAADVNFYAGAGIGGVASALMIDAISRRRILGADAAIGVVTTAMFAVGIALLSQARGFTRNFEAALFGNVLGVGSTDLAIVAVVAISVAAIVFVAYRPLLFSTFDPEVSSMVTRSSASIELLLSLMLAATIVATLQILGVTLIAAALVIPASTARMLTERFGVMMRISVALGALAGFLGVYLSYFLDVASGAAVVLVNATAFLVVFALTGLSRRTSSGR